MNINVDKAVEELAAFCRDEGMQGADLDAAIKAILEKNQNHNELSEQMPEPM